VTLRADDRVLLLDITSIPQMAAMARILFQGSLVAIGSPDEVDRARAALAEFDNVMFIEATPNQIPWRNEYFTKVVVPPHMLEFLRSAGDELTRLLAPGGEIVRERIEA
jgi:hypothetical protein